MKRQTVALTLGFDEVLFGGVLESHAQRRVSWGGVHVSVLAQIFVGWPGIIASLILLVVGIMKKRFLWALVGAILSIPFSLYLAATPRFLYMSLLPLFTFGSVYMG